MQADKQQKAKKKTQTKNIAAKQQHTYVKHKAKKFCCCCENIYAYTSFFRHPLEEVGGKVSGSGAKCSMQTAKLLFAVN